jgi:hypothetical protein
MKSIPSSAKERVRFEDGYHDLIHDKNQAQALHCIGNWIERELQNEPDGHVPRGGAPSGMKMGRNRGWTLMNADVPDAD